MGPPRGAPHRRTQRAHLDSRGELESAEEELAELREQRARAEKDIEQARRPGHDAEQRASALESLGRELAAATSTLSRVSGSERQEPWSHAAVGELEGKLPRGARDAARAREGELEREREQCVRRAAELESGVRRSRPEPLTLRDELDAELLASRYDELEARAGGARAGAPRRSDARCVVRTTPGGGAQARRPGAPAGHAVARRGPGFAGPSEPEIVSGDALVREGEAIRLTRLAPRPTLGRARREPARARARGRGRAARGSSSRRASSDCAGSTATSELRALVSKPGLFWSSPILRPSPKSSEEQARQAGCVERHRIELEQPRACAVSALETPDPRAPRGAPRRVPARGARPLRSRRGARARARSLRAREAGARRRRAARATLTSLIEALRAVPPPRAARRARR